VGRVFREETRARRNELCCFVVNSRRDAYTVTQGGGGREISMAVSMTEIRHDVGEIVESAKRGRVPTRNEGIFIVLNLRECGREDSLLMTAISKL